MYVHAQTLAHIVGWSPRLISARVSASLGAPTKLDESPSTEGVNQSQTRVQVALTKQELRPSRDWTIGSVAREARLQYYRTRMSRRSGKSYRKAQNRIFSPQNNWSLHLTDDPKLTGETLRSRTTYMELDCEQPGPVHWRKAPPPHDRKDGPISRRGLIQPRQNPDSLNPPIKGIRKRMEGECDLRNRAGVRVGCKNTPVDHTLDESRRRPSGRGRNVPAHGGFSFTTGVSDYSDPCGCFAFAAHAGLEKRTCTCNKFVPTLTQFA